MSSPQTHDVIALIKTLADVLKAAKADGSVDWWDLPKAAPVVVAVNAAIKDADQIPGELAAAAHSSAELSALLTEAITNALALVDAVLAK